MTDQLIKWLTAPKRRGDGLTNRQRVAIRLMILKGHPVAQLAHAYGVSRNTIYYSTAPERESESSKMVNKFIRAFGRADAWAMCVTPEDVRLAGSPKSVGCLDAA